MNYCELYSLSMDDRAAHVRKYGGFNDFPPGWREVSEADFAQSMFFTFAPDVVEYRQMLTPERDKPCVSATLYVYHDNRGIALVNDFWGKKVHYYFFGCEGPHPNRAKCPKCGFLADYDSSD